MSASPPWETYTEAAALELLGGNVDALRFVQDISHWTHFYDDLIDRDKPVSDAAVHENMWRLVVSIPTNAFFRAHQDVLRPVIVTGILNWQAANDIEREGSVEELRIAHTLRYSIADVLLLCMTLTCGREAAMKNARRARLMCQNDTWANYSSEHLVKDAT